MDAEGTLLTLPFVVVATRRRRLLCIACETVSLLGMLAKLGLVNAHGFWNSDVMEWFRDISSSNDSVFFFFGFMVDLEVHEHYFIW